MKRLILLAFILAFAGVAFATNTCEPHLFYIAKSDNANVIYYDANVKDGKFDRRQPINIYWIMYAERGQREGMTLLERPHFNITVREQEPGERYQINIRQSLLANKNMILSFENDCPVLVTNIGGIQSYIRNGFIQISPDSGILPNVQYIDIHGVSVADPSRDTTERVMRR